jgi:hypothetical protein
LYDPAEGNGILRSDPDLNISGSADSPLVFARDAKLPKFTEVAAEFFPRFDPSRG